MAKTETTPGGGGQRERGRAASHPVTFQRERVASEAGGRARALVFVRL